MYKQGEAPRAPLPPVAPLHLHAACLPSCRGHPALPATSCFRSDYIPLSYFSCLNIDPFLGCLIAYYFLAETWFAVLFTVIVEIVPPEVNLSLNTKY